MDSMGHGRMECEVGMDVGMGILLRHNCRCLGIGQCLVPVLEESFCDKEKEDSY